MNPSCTISKTANDFIKTKGLVILNFVGEEITEAAIARANQEYDIFQKERAGK